jgi:hypothetical protein
MPRECQACTAACFVGHLEPAGVWLSGYVLGFFAAVRQTENGTTTMKLDLCERHTRLAGEVGNTMLAAGGVSVKSARLEELDAEATPEKPERRLALVPKPKEPG